jgi:hypothetical protein
MTPPNALPHRARAVIELTRFQWGLGGNPRQGHPATEHRVVALERQVAASPQPAALVDRQHWPYWPDYPGAAVGWR